VAGWKDRVLEHLWKIPSVSGVMSEITDDRSAKPDSVAIAGFSAPFGPIRTSFMLEFPLGKIDFDVPSIPSRGVWEIL
jgi:hypothetical protein